MAPAKTRITVIEMITFALTLVIGVGSFILSFHSLEIMATHAGIPRSLAWWWPLIVDGLIVAATAALLALAGQARKALIYPWTLIILGAGISVSGNATYPVLFPQVLSDGFPVPLAALMFAIPPILLTLVTHQLIVLIAHRRQAKSSARRSPARRAARPTPAAPDRTTQSPSATLELLVPTATGLAAVGDQTPRQSNGLANAGARWEP